MISLGLECQKRIEENYQLKECKTKVMAFDYHIEIQQKLQALQSRSWD